MLKTRILTALVLLPLMIGALFQLPEHGWTPFIWLVSALGLWEWGRFFRFSVRAHVAYLGAMSAVAAAIWHFNWTPPLWVHALILLFWCGVAPLWLKQRWPLGRPWVGALLGVMLILPFWMAMREWRPTPAAAPSLLSLMALVWLADSAAYFAGKTFGRHKLAPSISPGKTWEGVAGALVAVTAYAFLLPINTLWQLHLPMWGVLGVVWSLTAVSIVGDLLESWFKRQAGVKDSSQLLPGHGGILDRIDSLIAVLAVAAALKALT